MVGCNHWLNGREFEQAPGVGEGQGSLACHNPWDRRVGHDIVTELMGSEVTVPKKQKPRPKGQPSTCPLGSWHFVFFVSLVKHRSNFLLLFRQANTNTVRIRKDLCPPTAQLLLDSNSHV